MSDAHKEIHRKKCSHLCPNLKLTHWIGWCLYVLNFPSNTAGQTVKVPLRTCYWTSVVSTSIKALELWPENSASEMFVLSGSRYFAPEVIRHLCSLLPKWENHMENCSFYHWWTLHSCIYKFRDLCQVVGFGWKFPSSRQNWGH